MLQRVKPRVTVLMPVYNGEEYVGEALDSILGQTCTDFEFLVIDDGSTDGSAGIIQGYEDPRIRFEQNGKNLGLVATLNKGLDLAQGTYVARMDCDDISLPERLQTQVEFMDGHLDVGVCGTWYETFGHGVRDVHSKMYFPVDYETIKAKLFFNSYLGHPTVMMRMASLNKYGLRYDPAQRYAEDYGLWITCSFLFPIVNIPKVLLRYRVSAASICQRNREEQRKTVSEIHKANIKRLGIGDVDEEVLKVHEHIVYMDGDFADGRLRMKAKSWLQRLKDANQIAKCYPEPYFSKVLAQKENGISKRSLFLAYQEPIVLEKYDQSKVAKIPVVIHTTSKAGWRDN